MTSWYQDVTLLERYWFGDPPVYHHTPPINLYYALREAARLAWRRGWRRGGRATAQLHRSDRWLEAMGLGMVVEPAYRLPSLTTVRVPEGVDEAAARKVLLNEFNIEIAGGLGDLKGKAWRVGLMGYSSQARNVTFLLGALGAALARQGHRLDVGAGLAAAQASLSYGQLDHERPSPTRGRAEVVDRGWGRDRRLDRLPPGATGLRALVLIERGQAGGHASLASAGLLHPMTGPRVPPPCVSSARRALPAFPP